MFVLDVIAQIGSLHVHLTNSYIELGSGVSLNNFLLAETDDHCVIDVHDCLAGTD